MQYYTGESAVDWKLLQIQINQIRNRSQSDISDKRRPERWLRTSKNYNRDYKQHVSKDEIDVANTLLNFNNIHINYKEATRYVGFHYITL